MIILKKLMSPRIWKRIFIERFTEPLHLNVLSIFVAIIGSYRLKIDFDLIIRNHNAYSILQCADRAAAQGIKKVTLIEFGVATGAGLLNMAEIAKNITGFTGIEFEIYGFDTGLGMPPSIDYRDHPDLYLEGDFPMNKELLQKNLPSNSHLILGEIKETVEKFLDNLSSSSPIGYVAIDVDYYSSTKDALEVFKGKPELYLPETIVYLDDVEDDKHNSYAGETLAINEYNDDNRLRKIERHIFLENTRIFKKPNWLKHIFQLHVMDHPIRQGVASIKREPVNLENPYC